VHGKARQSGRDYFIRVPTPTRADVQRPRIIIALAIVYLIWGSTYLAILFAIETLPPLLMIGSRFLIAGTILYAAIRARGTPKPTRENWIHASLIGVMLLACGTGVVVWAEERVASGIAALLVSVVPLWMVLIDWLRPRGRKPSAWVMAGVVVGLAGVWILADPLASGGNRNLFVEAMLMLAALSWAAGSVYSKHAPLPESKFLTTAIEMLAGGAALIFVGLVTGELASFHPHAVSARSWLSLLYLIVFGSLIAFSAYVWLLQAVSPALVSTYAFVNPVVAVFLGWAFASEPITHRTLVAAAIIIGGVALITIGRRDD
jgi:drug/metabolite transporter (DMT)-like permease